MKILSLLSIILPMTWAFSPPTTSNSRTKLMSQRITLFSVPRVKAGLKENPENTFLLDVRETNEWNHGHLALASHSPLSKLNLGPMDQSTGEMIPKDADIYIHCKSGGRAKVAAAILSKMGYKKVVPLGESFHQLVQEGICDVIVEEDKLQKNSILGQILNLFRINS
jgi:rhodanese-related sulfurtransferase